MGWATLVEIHQADDCNTGRIESEDIRGRKCLGSLDAGGYFESIRTDVGMTRACVRNSHLSTVHTHLPGSFRKTRPNTTKRMAQV